MNRDLIEAQVIEIAAEFAGIVEEKDTKPEHRFVEDLGYDSLDVVDYVEKAVK